MDQFTPTVTLDLCVAWTGPFPVPHSLWFPLPVPSAPCEVRSALQSPVCNDTPSVSSSKSRCAVTETFPETSSGISWLCSPPLTTELRVSWQSSLGILDNECVSCHVIKSSTWERKRCGFVPITKTNKQGLIFITGQGYSTSVFWNSNKLLKKVYSWALKMV